MPTEGARSGRQANACTAALAAPAHAAGVAHRGPRSRSRSRIRSNPALAELAEKATAGADPDELICRLVDIRGRLEKVRGKEGRGKLVGFVTSEGPLSQLLWVNKLPLAGNGKNTPPSARAHEQLALLTQLRKMDAIPRRLKLLLSDLEHDILHVAAAPVLASGVYARLPPHDFHHHEPIGILLVTHAAGPAAVGMSCGSYHSLSCG